MHEQLSKMLYAMGEGAWVHSNTKIISDAFGWLSDKLETLESQVPVLAPVATSGSYIDLSDRPTIPEIAPWSQATASRALNSIFQVSSTRASLVSYSVQITVTASIAGGQTGDVILEIASDAAFTQNVQVISIGGVGQTYTLAIALQGVQPQSGAVFGYVPAGYRVRLRTVNVSGSPAFSFRVGQEVLL